MFVLNGGSSSGQSTIARSLQAILPGPWLTFGTDTLVDAMPGAGTDIAFAADGEVTVGADFRAVEAAWIEGIAAMARAGARIIVDEVFLGSATSQQHWERPSTAWPCSGSRSAATAPSRRNAKRPDPRHGRPAVEHLHRGVHYDLEVDTSHTEPETCARRITGRLTSRPPGPSPPPTRRT